ncbi:MAG: hypothetical protein ABSB25_08980 [Sedimentisphaerales bacterium]
MKNPVIRPALMCKPEVTGLNTPPTRSAVWWLNKRPMRAFKKVTPSHARGDGDGAKYG